MSDQIQSIKSIYVITGPESSGKTTLVQRIQNEMKMPTVPEYARLYLEHIDRAYTFEDLHMIAVCQCTQEANAHDKYPTIVCDTDLITIDIWAQEKFGRSIEKVDPLQKEKHYLLCRPDIPWVDDPQRENPNDRDRLFDVYRSYLEDRRLEYEVLDKEGRASWKPLMY